MNNASNPELPSHRERNLEKENERLQATVCSLLAQYTRLCVWVSREHPDIAWVIRQANGLTW